MESIRNDDPGHGAPPGPGYVPIVEVVRGGIVESVHHGAVAVADADGALVGSAGDPRARSFMRSSAKPLQVLPMLESGAAERFGLTDEEIAVAVGSHHSEDYHVAAVRSILSKIGLPESLLMCGTHEPISRRVAVRLASEGAPPLPVHCNCSGKHAGMLALARQLGVDPEGYFRRDHPVQAMVLATMSEFTGLDPREMDLAVDGCTVPTFGVPLIGAATAFARLMEPPGKEAGRSGACRRVVAAMRAHPRMVGGEVSIDTDLMRESPVELVAKLGAEGYFCIGFRVDGRTRGAAIKIADGSMARARNAAALALVEQLGLYSAESLGRLREAHLPAVRNNRGEVVGRVRTLFRIG